MDNPDIYIWMESAKIAAVGNRILKMKCRCCHTLAPPNSIGNRLGGFHWILVVNTNK